MVALILVLSPWRGGCVGVVGGDSCLLLVVWLETARDSGEAWVWGGGMSIESDVWFRFGYTIILVSPLGNSGFSLIMARKGGEVSSCHRTACSLAFLNRYL